VVLHQRSRISQAKLYKLDNLRSGGAHYLVGAFSVELQCSIIFRHCTAGKDHVMHISGNFSLAVGLGRHPPDYRCQNSYSFALKVHLGAPINFVFILLFFALSLLFAGHVRGRGLLLRSRVQNTG
jgi:hypothetical protein